MPRMPPEFGFRCSLLDDPRRIELRRTETLDAYHNRGATRDLIEIGHGLTKLNRVDSAGTFEALTLFEQPYMASLEYTHDRSYPLQPSIRLPVPRLPDCSFDRLVRDRRSVRKFGGEPLKLDVLSSLLFGAIGETGSMVATHYNGRPITATLRSVPSAGALHPTSVFAVTLREAELAPGVYHYDVPAHSLELVKPFGDLERAEFLAAFPVHPEIVDLSDASAVFFISSKFWRGRAKYGPRGYRYCVQEAGAACHSLSLTAVALDLAHVILGGFYDDEIHASIEIDGVDHAVITAVAVGSRAVEHQGGSRHVGV
jgi:SagB-type dehydrogenase family enzyme